MKLNNKISSIAMVTGAILYSGLTTAEEGTVTTPVITQTLEVYQNGLMATVYADTKKTGTWASPKPIGTPIGEFVDAKVPAFSFGNLKQDDTAWSLYRGSHIGILWSGFFHAEESGNYVLMIDFVKEADTYYAANSCVSDFKLSDKSVLKNNFKLQREDYRVDDERDQKAVTTTLKLEPGYYSMNLWLHCGVTTNKWDAWTTDDPSQAVWTLKVKRPSDRIIQVAPAGTLVWK